MPIWEAVKLCPTLIARPARFERYAHYSRLFRKVCFDYSDRVEVFSIDELFMDLTETGCLFGGAIEVARALKRRMREEVGDFLTVSIGIAPNKMLSKLASGSQKPDGLVVVPSGKEARLQFLDAHPVSHICGIGSRIEKRLNDMGIFSIRQMRQVPKNYLKKEFGVLGETYWWWAQGEDFSPVSLAWEVDPDKSYGNQMTLPADTVNEKETMEVILWLCWQVAARLRDHGAVGGCVSLWLRRGSESGGAQKKVALCATAQDIYRTAQFIYRHKLLWQGPVRFVGVSVSALSPLPTSPLPLFLKDYKQRRVAQAWDKIAQKYGVFHLRPAALLHKQLKETVLNGFSRKF